MAPCKRCGVTRLCDSLDENGVCENGKCYTREELKTQLTEAREAYADHQSDFTWGRIEEIQEMLREVKL